MPSFLQTSDLPLWANLAIFFVGAAVIWGAGTRLSRYAEGISEHTGIGRAFLGALMLGGITSLPEAATTLTATVAGQPGMAVNNILGGVAMQVAVLALADIWVRKGSISSVPGKPVVLLQGNLLVLVLGLSAGGMVLGEPSGLPVGAWTVAILTVTVAGFWMSRSYEGHGRWEPIMGDEDRPPGERKPDRGASERDASDPRPLRSLILRATLAAGFIIAAGVAVTRSAEALATQTGLGTSFVGVALLALSTSLPEVSTTVAAVRLGRFDMAFSNVFGANLLDMALLFLTDAVAWGEPILNGVGRFSIVAALLAAVLTSILLCGVVWRTVRTVGRIGWDSLLVGATYLAGLYALFTLR